MVPGFVGEIADTELFQVKGAPYSLFDLLGDRSIAPRLWSLQEQPMHQYVVVGGGRPVQGPDGVDIGFDVDDVAGITEVGDVLLQDDVDGGRHDYKPQLAVVNGRSAMLVPTYTRATVRVLSWSSRPMTCSSRNVATRYMPSTSAVCPQNVSEAW